MFCILPIWSFAVRSFCGTFCWSVYLCTLKHYSTINQINNALYCACTRRSLFIHDATEYFCWLHVKKNFGNFFFAAKGIGNVRLCSIPAWDPPCIVFGETWLQQFECALNLYIDWWRYMSLKCAAGGLGTCCGVRECDVAPTVIAAANRWCVITRRGYTRNNGVFPLPWSASSRHVPS